MYGEYVVGDFVEKKLSQERTLTEGGFGFIVGQIVGTNAFNWLFLRCHVVLVSIVCVVVLVCAFVVVVLIVVFVIELACLILFRFALCFVSV